MGQNKIIRAVIDTNVVVSGLLFSGIPGELVSLWRSGRLQPFASADIVNEYIRVLAYPKFNLSEKEIEYLLHIEILPYFGIVKVDQNGPTIVREDPDDDKFLLCASAADVHCIISGDRHLLSLINYNKIKMLTPKQFLKSL
ncbi:MAG: putative toxin-antitoxin system toxin component, PIN family [Deltaproteobacteria bacterium]|nr:putative toxin-antitoxin system toxin component, PIN family [Deltaproteobacteria bacterium]